MNTARPPERIYGRCRECNGLCVYFEAAARRYFYLDGSPHPEVHPVDFLADPFVEEYESSNKHDKELPQVSETVIAPPKIAIQTTEAGTYYRIRSGGEEVGPVTVEDNEDPQSDEIVAKKLGVIPKEIILARLYEIQRPTNFDEIGEVLGSTIRHDRANKLIMFCGDLLTFTDQDQFNILMSGESSIGKSYTAMEVASYFPSQMTRFIATASPTAFFHDEGVWDSESRVLRVDLRQKLLIFLDQPHYTLMERLRPLLSHDRRELLYKITDKSKRGALRTKNVILEGYPTVIFCAAKLSLDEQERTRVFILSPQTGQEKLEESIQLRIKKDGDRQTFKKWVDSHPRRRWLKARVQAIHDSGVEDVIVEDDTTIYDRFLKTHQRLAPRHQRDISRIIGLIKAHALLNWCHRERRTPKAIVANREDLEAGFSLYSEIAKSNELGLAPQLYEIWDVVIRPLLEKSILGVKRRDIAATYHEIYGRFISDQKLRREILPALEASGLIIEEVDPTDRRQKLVCLPSLVTKVNTCPPDTSPISTALVGNRGNIWETPQ